MGVKSRAPKARFVARRLPIDQVLASDAATLTAFGVGTAFGLLILLTIIITVVGRLVSLSRRFGRGKEEAAQRESGAAAGHDESDHRDTALAAAIGVSVALERSKRSSVDEGGDSAASTASRQDSP